MLIRVRTNVGLWRVPDLSSSTSTVSSILDGIRMTRPNVEFVTPLCSDPACAVPLDVDADEENEGKTLAELGLENGSMVYIRVNPETCAEAAPAAAAAAVEAGEEAAGAAPAAASGATAGTMKRVIGKDGSIKLIPASEADPTTTAGGDSTRGFRKGMMALRDMKMQWTLSEFTAMDDRYVFKIQQQKDGGGAAGGGWIGKGGCSLDTPSANDFQDYLRRFNFQRQRFGLLYGRFVADADDDDDNDGKGKEKDGDTKMNSDGQPIPYIPRNVVVEAIYEPPQQADPTTPEGYIVLDDPQETKIETMASMLGLRRVGWIFGHPPREKGFQMSAAEIIMAAEFQLEAAGGVEPTPFVSVKVTVGDDGNVSFEAFQVSRQCMEMVAEEALEVGPNPGFCYVNDTFTAIQEGRESKTVENNFFLTVVPIRQHTSEVFVSDFPKANRDLDDRVPSKEEMKRQLGKSGTQGWTFVDVLSDFNLLIYLAQFLDVEDGQDMAKICASVADRDNVPLDDGYKIIISSIAGLDGSY